MDDPRPFACALALLLTTGCSALWTEPFEAHIEARLVIPLGADDDCAGTIAPGGERAPDGSQVSWSHAREGGACVIRATWRGPLLDMAEVRARTEQQLRDEGLDPDDVDISVTSVEPEVDAVTLRDGPNGEQLDIDARALDYTATISVHDAGDVVALANGAAHVTSSSALVAVANDAYAQRAALEGRGTAVARVDLAHASPVADAERPVLRIDFTVHVAGEARFYAR